MEIYKTVQYNLHNGKCMDHGFWYFTENEWKTLIQKIKKDTKFLESLTNDQESKSLVYDFLSGKREEEMCLLYQKKIYLRKIKLEASFI